MHHAQAKATDGETVVLLHGLARTRYCMRHLGQALEQQGALLRNSVIKRNCLDLSDSYTTY